MKTKIFTVLATAMMTLGAVVVIYAAYAYRAKPVYNSTLVRDISVSSCVNLLSEQGVLKMVVEPVSTESALSIN